MRDLKTSGVKWIGKIPASWTCKKIKYCYQFETGFTPDTSISEYYAPDGAVWVSISDLTFAGKTVGSSAEGISDIYLKQKHPKPVPEGSLLYSFKLSVGKCAFAERPLFTNEAIASFLPSSENDLGYLYYASSLIINNANENIYQAKLLNSFLISNALIPVPPIPEQKEIARYLDLRCSEIESLMATIEGQITVLERYRTSVIHELVTKGLNSDIPMKPSGVDWIGDIPNEWSINKIKNVSVLRTGRTPDSSEYNRYYNGDINWFTPADLNDRPVGLAQKSITRQAIKDGQAFIVPKNSVLVVGIGTVGKVGFLNVDASTNQQITSLVPNRKIVGRFLFYVIQDMKKIFNNLALYTTLPILNNQYIGNQIIPLPPIKVQKAIANYLDTHIEAIDLVLETKCKQIDTLRQHRQSLIYEYVTGKRSVGKED